MKLFEVIKSAADDAFSTIRNRVTRNPIDSASSNPTTDPAGPFSASNSFATGDLCAEENLKYGSQRQDSFNRKCGDLIAEEWDEKLKQKSDEDFLAGKCNPSHNESMFFTFSDSEGSGKSDVGSNKPKGRSEATLCSSSPATDEFSEGFDGQVPGNGFESVTETEESQSAENPLQLTGDNLNLPPSEEFLSAAHIAGLRTDGFVFDEFSRDNGKDRERGKEVTLIEIQQKFSPKSQ